MAIQPAITVLNPALRIIRINFAQLNLSQDNARQSLKHLFHALTRERRNLHCNGDIRLRGPARSLLLAHLPALGK
jgi:hypothetical protein